MDQSKEVRDRVFNAAGKLYEQNGRQAFPTVDAVRKLAKVNMAEASAGMKEWRRQQLAQVAQGAVPVPEPVQQAGVQAIAAIWQQAQAVAGEALAVARSEWEAERGEQEAMRVELSGTIDQQADLLAERDTELSAARNSLTTMERRALFAEQKAAESDALRTTITGLNADLAVAKANAERDRAAQDAAASELRDARRQELEAREEVARLKGMLEALTNKDKDKPKR